MQKPRKQCNAAAKYYRYHMLIILGHIKGSRTEDKSFAEKKVRKLDHRSVTKDTGYYV